MIHFPFGKRGIIYYFIHLFILVREMFVEVCIDRVQSAKNAQQGGASRVEVYFILVPHCSVV